ncbi:hypothetical protein [Burkholderia vietnamiensis]|uniref:hypothetical protein n=1 Tax=Burkholderia vietnamiensis TaxID=60552 RepID=UPI001B9B2D57|nr:hypothetical protein [Burkholderia vietnamiensis]MBR8030832.1 hypothetical protein [Burkholderia vietnamiensis]
MPNDNVLTIPRDLLQDLIDDVSDYAASREFKPREKVWRDGVLARARALLATPQQEPVASPGVIAAALAVIEADRSQTLTNEHVDALDIAIKIQRGMFKLPEPRAEVTDDDKADAARWRHFYSGHYIICKVYADGAVKNLGGGYVAKYAIDAARTGASS